MKPSGGIARSSAALVAVACLLAAAPSAGTEQDTAAPEAAAVAAAPVAPAVAPAAETPAAPAAEVPPASQAPAASGEPAPAPAADQEPEPVAEPAPAPPPPAVAQEPPEAELPQDASEAAGPEPRAEPAAAKIASSEPRRRAPSASRAAPGDPVTVEEMCDGLDPWELPFQYAACEAGVRVLTEICPPAADPGACWDEARSHMCVVRPFSAGCLAYLSRTGCVGPSAGTFECRRLQAMKNLVCSRFPHLDICRGSGGGAAEPLRPELAEAEPKALLVSLTKPDPDPDVIGITAPGALGDAGIRTDPVPARRPKQADLPFTGFPLASLAGIAAGLLAAGTALSVRLRRSR